MNARHAQMQRELTGFLQSNGYDVTDLAFARSSTGARTLR
jgi:hypothetical protein